MNERITPEAEFPLKYWFSQMSDEERDIIDNDIFNRNIYSTGPIENFLDTIKDQEKARSLMNSFRGYIENKKTGKTSAELKEEVADIVQRIETSLNEAEKS